jgi:hypothetical protein
MLHSTNGLMIPIGSQLTMASTNQFLFGHHGNGASPISMDFQAGSSIYKLADVELCSM